MLVSLSVNVLRILPYTGNSNLVVLIDKTKAKKISSKIRLGRNKL